MSKNPESLQNSAQVLEFEVGADMVAACVGNKKMIFSKSSCEGAFFHLCKNYGHTFLYVGGFSKCQATAVR